MKPDTSTMAPWSCAIVLLACLMLLPNFAIGQPYNKNYRFFVPTAQAGASATIDGSTLPLGVTDPLWNNAAKFDLDMGTNIPAAQMWAVRDNANLYLYFDVQADEFYFKDVLVLALGHNPAGGPYQRLHIFPCGSVDGSCPSVNEINHAPKVDYWTGGNYGTGGWTWPAAQTPLPTGFEAKSSFTFGSPSRWSVELRIPIAAFSLPQQDFFGLYADLADVTKSSGAATQHPWPPYYFDSGLNSDQSNIIGGSAGAIVSQIQSGTPSPDKWGLATLSNSGVNGVYVSDIRTDHPQSPTLISRVGPNRFFATARNDQGAGGNLVDAKSVSAKFFISGWGAGNIWEPVPPGGGSLTTFTNPNPTAPATVPATGSFQFEVGPWSLTQPQMTKYSAPNDHQCIRVELSSNDPQTLIFNPIKQQNIDFVQTRSPFFRQATVGTVGLNLPEGTGKSEIVLTERFFNTDPKQSWKSKINLESKLGQYIVATNKEKRTVSFDVAVQPPPMKIVSSIVKVPAGSAKIKEIAVKPGNVITLFAQGSVVMRKNLGRSSTTGPSGRDFTGDAKLFETMYPNLTTIDTRRSVKMGSFLLEGRGVPQTRAGALIGSWDSFQKSSFFIGEASTLKVPKSAKVLSLAINDVPKAASKRQGDGYTISVIQTPLRSYFGNANPQVWRNATFDSFRLPIGANLPTWIMRAEARTGKVIVIDGETFDALEPLGSFGAVINKIGP